MLKVELGNSRWNDENRGQSSRIMCIINITNLFKHVLKLSVIIFTIKSLYKVKPRFD